MRADENDRKYLLSETGIKIAAGAAGGAAGGIIGLLIAGPSGAVGGAIVGNASVPLLENLGLRFYGILGQREERRVLTLLDSASLQIRRNQASELPLRADGFLALESPDHSAAEEICEAVIRKAQVEYEEKKIRFQGVLLGNLPFRSDIDRAEANLLVRLAFQLSYRQLCLLALFYNLKDHNVRFIYKTPNPTQISSQWENGAPTAAYSLATKIRDEERDQAIASLTGNHHSVRQEAYDLYTMGLIGLSNDGLRDSQQLINQFLYGDVIVRPLGQALYRIMGLRDIEHSELEYLANLMRNDPTYS